MQPVAVAFSPGSGMLIIAVISLLNLMEESKDDPLPLAPSVGALSRVRKKKCRIST